MKKFDERMIDFLEQVARDDGILVNSMAVEWHGGKDCKIRNIDMNSQMLSPPKVEAAILETKSAGKL